MFLANDSGEFTEYLDAHCGPEGVRVDVGGICAVEEVGGLYFVRSASIRLLWNYLLEIGVRSLISKVRSRRAERIRNSKFLLIGYGTVIQSKTNSTRVGARVVFVAPRHAAFVDRIVLSENLIQVLEANCAEKFRWLDECYFIDRKAFPGAAFISVAGWDPDSGNDCPRIDWNEVVEALDTCQWKSALPRRSTGAARTTRRRNPKNVDADDVVGATLFGYGNYAKTVILPSLPSRIRVTRVHEIDPLQIPSDDEECTWDTSSIPDLEDHNSVWFIAGYHHSHAPLAVEALLRGRVAVSEKPLVVDTKQLANLTQAVRQNDGRYFACFHKRYSRFNEFALMDLDAQEERPISYHCIVYEVPLPSRHWYRWPNSRSRVVSNGCHWIDHFLFLNHYKGVRRTNVMSSTGGDLNVSVELENGAFFTMVLTEKGGSRTGMQDYIELRTGSRTVRIENGSRYRAESDSRILRSASINKMLTYRSMYKTIGESLLSGGKGDSLQSISQSSELMLLLDAQTDGH